MSSGRRAGAYSILLVAAVAPASGRARPAGTLTLDAADPVIVATVAGMNMRLRVDPGEHGMVLLNRAAAARLPLRWQEGAEIDVGRVRLSGATSSARVTVEGRRFRAAVVRYDRDCCAGSDGAIGPDTLPYAAVRWSRRDAPDPTAETVLPLEDDSRTGPTAEAAPSLPGLRLSFTLYRSPTVATAAGAALLAAGWGGRWDGAPAMGAAPFGLTRPVRVMRFARAGRLAGFAIDRIAVRIADFGGHAHLPVDVPAPDDIVVTRALPPQEAWPAVILGPDRLRLCAEIVYAARPPTLTLRCAFDAATSAIAPPSSQPAATSLAQ